MSELVPVHIDCPCPGTPHQDGDDVFLRANPGLVGGVMIQNRYAQISERLADHRNAGKIDEVDVAEAVGELMHVYLRAGIESWTLVDADGKPLPVSKETIADALEANWSAAKLVADKADELYEPLVLSPLAKAARNSSQGTPTNGSTSVTNGRTRPRRPKPSKRSSTSTSQTGVTVTTSQSSAGVSSSSPS